MTGDKACLVTRPSATSCLPSMVRSDRSIPMDRTHSELVKFALHDWDRDEVCHILDRIYGRCLPASNKTVVAEVAAPREECAERLLHVVDGQGGDRSPSAQCM
jgi:hypothetical protein